MEQTVEIEKVINVFSDYIKSSQTFDLVKSKYGYVILIPANCNNTCFDIRICSTATGLCEFLLEWLTMEYAYENGDELLLISKEREKEFLEHMRIYLKHIPEYWYLLDQYLESKNKNII